MNERAYDDLIDALDVGVLIYETRVPHHLLHANRPAERLIGHPVEGFIGRRLGDLFRQVGQPGASLLARLAEAGAEIEIEVTTPWRAESFPLAFGLPRPIDDNASLIVLRDLTDEWHLREELGQLRELFDYSPEAIMITDAAGTILRVNPAFSLITGYAPHEVLGKNPRMMRSGRHDAAFYADFWRTLVEEGHWHGEIWDKRKNGEEYPKWLCINAVVSPTGARRYVALFADISERKAHETRVQHLALHDALTGLANRRQLERRARHLFAAERRGEASAALMLLDLDHFKAVNDTLGHAAGDRLLVEAAGRIRSSVRASDLVVRLGGDEFVVVLEGVNEAREISAVADKLREELARPYRLAGCEICATPSIGIALCPQDGKDLDTLLAHADLALYRVKQESRNGWRFYSAEMDEAARAHRALVAELRAAIETDALRLVYQPQFDLPGRRIVAWEALLRWPHPARGELLPGDFLPLAEETGLIHPLGAWVLRRACRDIVALSERRGEAQRVAVNVSARQLAHPDFVAAVEAALTDSGLPADRLELEFTERTLFGPEPAARDNLTALARLGVRIAVDDFGAGYTTLVDLTRTTVDRLKIDRAFVARHAEPGQAAIVAATIALAAALGIEVVAEGVESAEALAFLIEKGCLRAQGFYCGRPMSLDEAAHADTFPPS